MKNKCERRVYEPPRVKDLSVFGVNGGPLGTCNPSGTTPYEACMAGPSPNTTCGTGNVPGLTPDCNPGNFPGGPTCNPTGSIAFSWCRTGNIQA